MQLKNLEPSDTFKFIEKSLTKRFRNLKVRSVSDSSVSIDGEISVSDGFGTSWKPLGPSYTIAPTIEVEKVEEGYYKEASVSSIKKEKREKREQEKANHVPGKRGRKASTIVLTFPFNKEFTIREVAKKNDTSPSNVNIYLKKNFPHVKLVRQEKSESGRGKPSNVYFIKQK